MNDHKMVPVEPTAEMLAAGKHAMEAGCYASGIYADMLAAAPAVQGESVAWSGWGCQYPGKMPRLYGERRIAELNCDWENGDQLLSFTAAPHPAEQQPAPDVAELQAECEKWKRGSEIRDEQNQDLHSFIMELKAECEKLRAAMIEAKGHISHYMYGGSSYREPAAKAIALIDAALATHRQGGE